MSNERLIANRYQAGGLLGQGPVGVVYRGTDTQTGHPVAIKLLRSQMVASNPKVVEHFARKAEALRALNHRNIVKVLETAQERDKLYLVMEFVPGGSLRDVLAGDRQLSVARSLAIALDLADALTHAHRLGIIHRDIKPANVLLAKNGTPRLTDFSLAQLLGSSRLTQTSMPAGNIHYFSPEACQGEETDARTDIWSLGVLLFEMLAGRCPFDADNPLALALAITTTPVPDLEAFRPDAPVALADLIYRMLEKDHGARIPSVRLVGAELEAIMRVMEAPSGPAHPMPRGASPALRTPGSPTGGLPIQTIPLVGRQAELAELAALFADPQVHLVTLFGPGGIGKTRLALEAAQARLSDLQHGVHFVPLAPLSSPGSIVPAIAEAVGFRFYERGDSRGQLLNFLRHKQMLLILDNFEHLLTQPVTELITDILATAPRVKLLVTSREVLNLTDEWLFPVQGLRFPKDAKTGDLEAYAAVQLFAQRARRVRRDFSLAAEGSDVIRICQLVEGLPLALELAASWTKTMRCAVIAAEIERNIAFLASGLRDIPERHRSIQTVFDHTWTLLTGAEQDVLKRLSVFRGGFRRKAAEQVAGATLPILSALVEKSLLRWEPDGRYHTHELLRQCAWEKLAGSPEQVATVKERHGIYFLTFLYERGQDLNGGRQREAIAEIRAALENIRMAWQWAVSGARVEEIRKSAQALSLFFQFQSRYQEGADALVGAARSLRDKKPVGQAGLTLALVLVELAWLHIRLGQVDEAQAASEQSRALYASLGALPPPGQATDPLLPLGIIASIAGNYDEAARLGEQACQLAQVHDHRGNLPFAHYLLTSAALAQGDYEGAWRHAQRAHALVQETNDRWFMAYCLNELGHIARALGDYAAAKTHYQQSYAIREAFDDPEGMAVALNHLGMLAILQEDYPEAKRLYQHSLMIYQDINDRGGLAASLNGLARAACALQEYQDAWEHFRQALRIATDIQYVPLTFSILIGIGELLLQTGASEQGIELLALVRHHSSGDQETKDRAQQLLDRYRAKLIPAQFAVAEQHGWKNDLQTVIAAVQSELVTPKIDPDSPSPTPVDRNPGADQGLIDPVTPRELEVLHLIAQGLTNQEIADVLVISVGTVKWYTSEIYSKLYVGSRTQAVARARELGLLS